MIDKSEIEMFFLCACARRLRPEGYQFLDFRKMYWQNDERITWYNDILSEEYIALPPEHPLSMTNYERWLIDNKKDDLLD